MSAGADGLGRAGRDQQDAGDQIEADQFHGARPVASGRRAVDRRSGAGRADGQAADECVDPGDQRAAPGMAAQHDIEGERPAGLGEEPLGPRLAAQAAAEQIGPEVVGGQRPGHALAGEEAAAQALGAVLEQHGEDVVDAHEVDGPAAEVGDVGREGRRWRSGPPDRAPRRPTAGRTKMRPSNPPAGVPRCRGPGGWPRSAGPA